MCGMVGYMGARSGVELRAARRALAHRGPDGHGEWTSDDGAVGLARSRRAIIDLSPCGHQPMLSKDGQVALTYNGEIYNFVELRAELQDGGVRFRGHSETEVLLALCLHDGAAMSLRLNGIFAFSIHDQRSNELLLVRDALGVRN